MGKVYTNTYWSKKANPNSWWYQKRHPSAKIIEPVSTIFTPKKPGFWNKSVSFIKKIGQLCPQRVTKPKGELK
jgi:hypothetical protein